MKLSLGNVAGTISSILVIAGVTLVYFERSSAIDENREEIAEQQETHRADMEALAAALEATTSNLNELIQLKKDDALREQERYEMRVEQCQIGEIPRRVCREKYGIRVGE